MLYCLLTCESNLFEYYIGFIITHITGAEPIDGVTTVNPEGLTTATGIYAEAFQAQLASLGLKCNVVDAEKYKPAMFEKLM